MRGVLAIFLDGYENSLGQRLMRAGEMPEMTRLAASSARFLLEFGSAQRTGRQPRWRGGSDCACD